MKLLTQMFLLVLTAFVLVTAAYAEDSVSYAVEGGSIYFDKATGAIMDCDRTVTRAVIPTEIDGISVTSIRDWACSYAKVLEYVKIPNSVTYIGSMAFSGCSNLTSVEIPNSVTFIGGRAFSYCTQLPSVTISSSVTSVGYDVFYECDSLRDVYYSGSKEQWEKIDKISYSGLVSNNVTIHYNASIPDTPTAPKFEATSAPTVSGNAIRQADLSGLTEISVPVTVSAESAASVTICVPFFDGGKFVGMGFVAATVDKNTTSVTVPVTGNVSGAEKMDVIFLDADFRPLSTTGFDIAA